VALSKINNSADPKNPLNKLTMILRFMSALPWQAIDAQRPVFGFGASSD
jgi:hypothetical protein